MKEVEKMSPTLRKALEGILRRNSEARSPYIWLIGELEQDSVVEELSSLIAKEKREAVEGFMLMLLRKTAIKPRMVEEVWEQYLKEIE